MQPNLRSLGVLLFTFATFWISSAFAGIIVTGSAMKPSTDVLVDFSVSATNFTYPFRWIGDEGYPSLTHMEVGQSFLISKADDVILDKITVRPDYHVGGSVAGQDYTLEIWTMSAANDADGDALLSSQSDTFPTSGLSNEYLTFDIQNVRLTNNHYYAFILGFNSGPASGREVDLVGSYVGGFSDGRLINRIGTPPAWNSGFSARDLDFSLQGRVVPEPSSVILWSTFGVIGLVIAWRRRKRAA